MNRPRRFWKAIGKTVSLLAVLLVADYLFYPWGIAPPIAISKGHDALWLRDSWYLGTEKEPVSSLATRLKTYHFRDAYFHVRYIQKDGALHFRQPQNARRLVQQLHEAAPNVRALAWIYAGNARGLTGIDLHNPQIRGRMVREAVWLCTSCGFDGVQWDYEICADGDADLLALLEETRAALPKGKILSVATPMWLPGVLKDWGWSEAYFSQVAARSDQIVVMAYDSGLYLPRAYVWLVKQQTIRVTRAVKKSNPACEILIGLPTYEKGGLSHHARAENLRFALRGVVQGLQTPQGARCDGVAIFADYTTGLDEWNSYTAVWKHSGSAVVQF